MKRRYLTYVINSQIEISTEELQPFVNYTSTTSREYHRELKVWIKREDSEDRLTTQELYDEWKAIPDEV